MVDLNAAARRGDIEAMFFGYRAFTEGPDRILAPLGLGRVHHRILYFVGRNEGLSVGDLVRAIRVTKQALNAPLRDLSARGLVIAASDPADRRVRRLSLSSEGRTLEARLTQTQLGQLDRAFAAAGADGAEAWRGVMARLAEVF